MTAEFDAAAAIAGMALVTYGLRCGGVWIARRVSVTPRTERMLLQLPPTLLISVIAPIVIAGGARYAVGTTAAVVTAAKSNSVVATMAVGVATVVLLRSWLG
jgi:uncharacterized membrane protein